MTRTSFVPLSALLSGGFLLLLSAIPPAWAAERAFPGSGRNFEFTVRENRGTFSFGIFLVAPCERDLCSLDFRTEDDTARAGRDYQASTGRLTWPRGDDSRRTISIPIIDNDIFDGNRRFSIVYSSSDGSINPIGSSVDTVTILDDETPAAAPPTVTITQPADGTEIEVGDTVTFAASADSVNPQARLGLRWVFGDGATPAASTASVPVAVTFTTSGSRTVTVTARDADNGLSASASVVITVREPDDDGDDDGDDGNDIVDQVAKFATTPGQDSMAGVIGTICPQGIVTVELQRDCDALIGAALDDDPATGDALAAVTPDQTSTPADASLNSIRVQSSNIGARLAALRAGTNQLLSLDGLSFDLDGTAISGRQMQSLLEAVGGGAGDDEAGSGFSRLGVFVSGRIGAGERDRTDNVEGFEYDITGLTVGVDYRFTDQLILGGALGYSRTDTDIDADRGTLDADSYALTLFGSWYRDNLFIDGSLSYGRGDYDQERRLRYTLPDRAEVDQTFFSSFDGDQFGLDISAGYEIRRDALTLIPGARLQYIRADVDGYRENRSSSPDLDGSGWAVEIDEQRFKSLNFGLGGQANYAIGQSWGVLLPFVSAEWVHEFEDNDDAVTGRFVGDPSGTGFVIPVDGSDSNYFNVGVGVSAQFTNGTAGFIDYRRILGYDEVDHYTINAGLRFEF